MTSKALTHAGNRCFLEYLAWEHHLSEHLKDFIRTPLRNQFYKASCTELISLRLVTDYFLQVIFQFSFSFQSSTTYQVSQRKVYAFGGLWYKKYEADIQS